MWCYSRRMFCRRTKMFWAPGYRRNIPLMQNKSWNEAFTTATWMWVMMHSAWSGADVSNDFYFCRLRQLFFFTHRTEQMCWLFPVCVSIERCLFMGPTIVRPVHVALIGLEVLSLKLVFESHFGKIYKSLFFLLQRHQLNRMFHCQRPRVSRCSGSTMELNTYDSFSFSRFAFLQVEFWNLFFSFIVSVCGLEIEFCVFLSISAFVAIRWTRRASGDEANVHKWHYGFINIQPRRSE